MKYNIVVSSIAKKQIQDFKKSDAVSFKKIIRLFEELSLHPQTGTGKPEQLKGDYSGYWSRRINKKDRLIYKIEQVSNEVIEIEVYVLSAKGHYDDK